MGHGELLVYVGAQFSLSAYMVHGGTAISVFGTITKSHPIPIEKKESSRHQYFPSKYELVMKRLTISLYKIVAHIFCECTALKMGFKCPLLLVDDWIAESPQIRKNILDQVIQTVILNRRKLILP